MQNVMEQTKRYYSTRICKLMNEIEDITGKMFHESYPELMAEIEKAVEIRELRVVNSKLCGLVDALTMD